MNAIKTKTIVHTMKGEFTTAANSHLMLSVLDSWLNDNHIICGSTLIRGQKTELFVNDLQSICRNLKTLGDRFCVDGKDTENEAFRNYVISLN